MRGFFVGKEDIGNLMDSPRAACSTATKGEKSTFKGQEKDAPIAPCPSCGVGVVQKRVGGSMRRFCCASCRWAWNRQERRRRLMEAIEAATCSRCRAHVIEALSLSRGGNIKGGAAP